MSNLPSVLKSLVPRFQRRKLPAVESAPAQSSQDLIETPALWWKHNKYTAVDREVVLRWLGRDWLAWRYHESILGNYFKSAHELVGVVEAMQRAGFVVPLGKDSKVLEPGCNIGRNLYALHRRYGCWVYGVDISTEAIELARTRVWRGNSKATFWIDNVLSTRLWDDFADASFDLVITRWHLVHLVRSPIKQQYVERLKRLARTLIVLEPVPPGGPRPEVIFENNGEYCLSFDNWQADYGLRPFPTADRRLTHDHTYVFYHTK